MGDKMKKKKKRKGELKTILDKYGDSLNWLEEGELRSWVSAGNSPYTNPEDIIHENGIPFDFIEWHRSARWITEDVDLYQPPHFDTICYYIDSDYTPNSRKKAVKRLHYMRKLLGNEIQDMIGFLRSENLMERYLEYKYCEGIPFV